MKPRIRYSVRRLKVRHVDGYRWTVWQWNPSSPFGTWYGVFPSWKAAMKWVSQRLEMDRRRCHE